jgi:cytochrome c oxidase assembly factor CtaG
MQWWCSATGQPWTWAWKAYPGVWLFVGLLGYWYWRAIVRPAGPIRGRSISWFAAGLLCIWVGLDWPVGALGAGYLATFHTVTYILLSLVAPPCLLLGIPESAVRRGLTDRLGGPLIRGLARPLIALTIFNVILLVSHVPAVVDGAMSSQLGALAIDLGWFLAGIALWWPVLAPAPDIGRLGRPMKMAYLFAATLVPIIPSAFLTFAEYPLYSTYELAPRIFEKLTAQQDQQVAGLIMKLVGDLPIWFAFGVLFFRWAKASEVTPPPDHPGSRNPIPSQV